MLIETKFRHQKERNVAKKLRTKKNILNKERVLR